MASLVDTRIGGTSKTKQQDFKDFLEESGIVKCITVAFTTLYDTKPKAEEGLAAFQKLIAKSYDIKLEGEEKKNKELQNQVATLAKEKIDLIQQTEKLEIEIKQLKQDRKKQRHENHEIRRQLIQIRKELRATNPNSSSLPEVDDIVESSSSDDEINLSMDLVSPQTISAVLPKSDAKESLPSNKRSDIQTKDETVKKENSCPSVSVTEGVALKKDTLPPSSGSFLDEIKASGGAASLKKDEPSSLPPPSSGSFLDEIKASGGAASLKKDGPPPSSGSFLDEIKARGGAASLKKDRPPPLSSSGSFLDEIKARGGAASLKKDTLPPLSSSGSFLDEIKARGGAASLKKDEPSSLPPPSSGSLRKSNSSLPPPSSGSLRKSNSSLPPPSSGSLRKSSPSLPPPSSGSFLDEIKARGGAASLKKDGPPPLSSSGSFLDEIKARGGAASLKKKDSVNTPPPVPELPGNDFLAEIRAKGGAAALKKN